MTMTTPPVLLKGDDLFEEEMSTPTYDRAREISKYLLMHYGRVEDMFADPGHPLAPAHGYPERLSRLLQAAAARTGVRVASMLDIGCNVGGVTHALGGWVEELVVGVDLSPRAIEIAQALTGSGGGVFSVAQLGPYTEDVEFRLPRSRARVRFEVGDGTAIRGRDGGYDAVLLSNVLDRVADPAACLAQFSESEAVLRRGGLLMVACPWSWYPEYSHPGAWLGSARDGTSSESALKTLLSADFDLVDERNEPGVLRQNPREYDYFEAQVTIWHKR
jgi:SAM-dependent methyltransferase